MVPNAHAHFHFFCFQILIKTRIYAIYDATRHFPARGAASAPTLLAKNIAHNSFFTPNHRSLELLQTLWGAIFTTPFLEKFLAKRWTKNFKL